MAIDVSQDWVGLFCAFQVDAAVGRVQQLSGEARGPAVVRVEETNRGERPLGRVGLDGLPGLPPVCCAQIWCPTSLPTSRDRLSRKKMDSSAMVVPLFCLVQVRPASAEWSRAPSNPLVHAWLPTVKTERRCSLVPLVRACHVLAPSSVASRVPASPTAKPWVASKKEMACSVTEAPVSRAVQVAPAVGCDVDQPLFAQQVGSGSGGRSGIAQIAVLRVGRGGQKRQHESCAESGKCGDGAAFHCYSVMRDIWRGSAKMRFSSGGRRASSY
jgi:hypothetical protein